MSWTYDATQLATSKLYQVRLLVGDVDSTEPKLQDEEITFALTIRATSYGAAADCARMIAAKLSPNVDMRAGDTEIKSSQDQKAYLQMAMTFEARASAIGAGLPFSGGIGRAQKTSQEQDQDRVAPAFVIGQDDDYIPVAPARPTPGT
ncbi:MAG: hypothetical protein ACRECU_13990 [Methylocella sp.]